MKKKILVIALALSLVAVTALGVTLAYFTDTKEASNVFTVGNVRIRIDEPKWASTGSKDAPSVYPGESLDKDPTIVNIGENPCFVRVKVEVPEQYEDLITFRTNYQDGAFGAGWERHGEYYYYRAPLTVYDPQGSKSFQTTPLFQQVRFSTELTADDLNADGQITGSTPYDIKVTAQAVQAQGIFTSYSELDQITDAEFATIRSFFDGKF